MPRPEAIAALLQPPFLLLVAALTLLVGPFVFINNADPSTLFATFSDSGSLTVGLVQMTQEGNFCNPHVSFHTSMYGWAPNSLLCLQFAFFRHALAVDTVESFWVYAALAKANNFLFTLAALGAFQQLAERIFPRSPWPLWLSLSLACSAPMVLYSSQVHPEPAGLFFSLLALRAMLDFMEEPSGDSRFLYAVLYAALAALSKPPFGLIFACAGGAYLFARLPAWRSGIRLDIRREVLLWAGCIAIVLACVLAAHPYMLLQFHVFLNSMGWLYQAHSTGTPIGPFENTIQWFRTILGGDLVVMIGLLSSMAYLATSRRRTPVQRLVWLICALNLAHLLWLCLYVRRPYAISYLYPVFPTLLLASTACCQCLSRRLSHRAGGAAASRFVFATLVSALLLNGAYHLLFGVARLSDLITFEHTQQAAARAFLEELGERPWRVLHDPSVPVPKGLYERTWLFYVFRHHGDGLPSALKRRRVDAIVADRTTTTPRYRDFVPAAEEAGLVHELRIPSACPDRVRYAFRGVGDIFGSLDAIRSNLTRAAACDRQPEHAGSISVLTRVPID